MLLNRLKLKHQIILIILLSLVILVFIEIYYYFSFFNLTQARAIQYENKIIHQTKQKIESVLVNIKKHSDNLVFDNKVQKFLIEKNHYMRDVTLGNYVTDLVNTMIMFDSNVYSIIIEDNSGRGVRDQFSTSVVIGSNNYNKFINVYKEELKNKTIGKFTSVLKNMDIDKELFFYVIPMLNIESDKNFGARIGYCTIGVKTQELHELIENTEITKSSTIFIMNEKNEVVISNNKENNSYSISDILSNIKNKSSSRSTIINGKSVILQETKIDQIEGWKIISVIPINELALDMNSIKNLGIIASIGMFMGLLLIWLVFFRSITQPVFNLVSDMKKVLRNRKSYNVRVTSNNEVGMLAIEVNNMLKEIEHHTKNTLTTQTKLYEAELYNRQAEFSFLQSQINPHFLYNTLNCISSIGISHGIKEVSYIATSMSKIFQYSIKGQDIVKIGAEIDCIRSYFSIHEILYGDRLKINYKIDESILELMTPKMILQPILENSVLYGVEKNYRDITIQISANLTDDDAVIFEIFDNGNGFDEVQLNTITEKLNMNYSEILVTKAQNSIGLININNRIKLLYGEEFGIKINSKENEWTSVTIKIPKMTI